MTAIIRAPRGLWLESGPRSSLSLPGDGYIRHNLMIHQTMTDYSRTCQPELMCPLRALAGRRLRQQELLEAPRGDQQPVDAQDGQVGYVDQPQRREAAGGQLADEEDAPRHGCPSDHQPTLARV